MKTNKHCCSLQWSSWTLFDIPFPYKGDQAVLQVSCTSSEPSKAHFNFLHGSWMENLSIKKKRFLKRNWQRLFSLLSVAKPTTCLSNIYFSPSYLVVAPWLLGRHINVLKERLHVPMQLEVAIVKVPSNEM